MSAIDNVVPIEVVVPAEDEVNKAWGRFLR